MPDLQAEDAMPRDQAEDLPIHEQFVESPCSLVTAI